MPLWDKTGTKPHHLNRAEKRNVMATDYGWVRRINKVNDVGGPTTQEEILVAIGGLAGTDYMGAPAITDVWHSTDTAVTGEVVITYVAWDEPIELSGERTIAVTPGTTGTADSVVGAGNVLAFEWTPLTANTYTVAAQTIGGAGTVVSGNAEGETADMVISAPVATASGSVIVTEA